MVEGLSSGGRNRKKRRAHFSGLVLPVLFAIGVLGLVGCGDSTTAPAVEVFIESPIVGGFMVGEDAHLRATLTDPSVSGTVSWTSSDTAVVLVTSDGHIWAQRPGSTTVSATFRKAKADLVVTVIPRPGGYTAPEIDYFQEIAFGFEYGAASETIRKWGVNPRLQILGSPTAEDRATLESVVSELNVLMEEAKVELVDSDPSVEIHFAPLSAFPTILPSYVSGNWGYFSVWFDGSGRIYRSVVLVASDVTTQAERAHLIREEVTQMLGLAKDSNRYSSSIFYSQWTTTQVFAPIDEALIEMLYRPQTLVGLEYRGAVNTLRTMTRRGWEGSPTAAVSDSAIHPFGVLQWRAERRGKGGIGSGGGTAASPETPSLIHLPVGGRQGVWSRLLAPVSIDSRSTGQQGRTS